VTTHFRGAVQARETHSDYSRTFFACASRLQARQSSNAYADGDALSYDYCYCYSFGDYEHYYFAVDRWDGATDDAVDGACALYRVCLG
jgi:hypothetical protein